MLSQEKELSADTYFGCGWGRANRWGPDSKMVCRSIDFCLNMMSVPHPWEIDLRIPIIHMFNLEIFITSLVILSCVYTRVLFLILDLELNILFSAYISFINTLNNNFCTVHSSKQLKYMKLISMNDFLKMKSIYLIRARS